MEQQITAADILAAIAKADSEQHPARQAYFGTGELEDLEDWLFDGRINLIRVAEILSEHLVTER